MDDARFAIAAERGQHQLRQLALLMCAINLLLPAGLWAWAGWVGDDYWDYFWGEDNAITWYSSVQLLVVAGVAWANGEVLALGERLGNAVRGRRWIWWVFAAGFVFLSLDERFEFHETVRDDWLKPANAFYGLPFIRPGDVGLYVYLGVGLLLAIFLLAELRRDRRALALFAAGVGLAAATTVVDALPRDVERQLSYFWTSIFEEVGELWSQLLFLLSFAVLLHRRLGELARGEP